MSSSLFADGDDRSYCSIFYNEVASSRLCSGTTVASRNVRGGTTLHELTHAVAGTTDVGYGCSFDQNLGQTNPSQALRNADNYNVRICCRSRLYGSGADRVTMLSVLRDPGLPKHSVLSGLPGA